jgi:hypothetical protein
MLSDFDLRHQRPKTVTYITMPSKVKGIVTWTWHYPIESGENSSLCEKEEESGWRCVVSSKNSHFRASALLKSSWDQHDTSAMDTVYNELEQ